MRRAESRPEDLAGGRHVRRGRARPRHTAETSSLKSGPRVPIYQECILSEPGPPMKYKDYYATLGVDKTASADEIKKAYRKLARKYHPGRLEGKGRQGEVSGRLRSVRNAERPREARRLRPARQLPAGAGFPSAAGLGAAVQPGGRAASRSTTSTWPTSSRAWAAARGGFRGGGARAAATCRYRAKTTKSPASITLEQAYHGTMLDLNLQMPEYDEQGRLRRVPHTFKARIPPGRHRRRAPAPARAKAAKA